MEYIIDPKIPLWMNIFVISANVINIVYNVPQMWHTYKSKTTQDISGWFLFLRLIGNSIWTWYSFYIENVQLIISNVVPVISTSFIGYYKIKEIIKLRRDTADSKDTLVFSV